ncbi:MAG: hypothetical protein HY562_03840 [Ignavibacteriales bacterium]|nr:hypothetical protein [Ignavibacteriales bacterium]
MSILLPGMLLAQTQSTGKKEPERRKIELGDKPIASQATKPLPKIDLPEFVITGNASIDLPDAEKILFEERLNVRPRLLTEAGDRDRGTADLSAEPEGMANAAFAPFLRGRATASIGTFFSPKLNLWIGRIDSDIEYSGAVDYARTTGFAPFTDRSGGGISLNGGMILRSSLALADRARTTGAVNYRADAYRFYGSVSPQASRNLSRLFLATSMTSPDQLAWSYEASIDLHSNSITDSSSRTGETQLDIGLTTLYPTTMTPVRFDMTASLSFLGGATSSSLTYIEMGLGLDRLQWKSWFLTASARIYGAGGMDGQSLSKMYPHVSLGYEVSRDQSIEAYYNPKVDFWNFSRHIAKNPFVSTASSVRHSDAHQAGGVAWQASWSTMLRTRLSAEAKSYHDYPLYADSASQGMWVLVYGGTTTLIRYRGELFAKFSPIDYFASALVMNSSRNSLTGRAVPYVPDLEFSAAYTHDFPFGVSATGSLTFFHGMVDNVVDAASLKGALFHRYPRGISNAELVEDVPGIAEHHQRTIRVVEGLSGFSIHDGSGVDSCMVTLIKSRFTTPTT